MAKNQFPVILDKETKEKLVVASKKESLSLSAFMRRAAVLYCNNLEESQ
jgi:hypothetical protein